MVAPSLSLPSSRDFHGIQELTDGGDADPFGIHLLDGGDGAQFSLVVYDFAIEPPFAIGYPAGAVAF